MSGAPSPEAPPSLRTHLRELQSALEEAAAEYLTHRQEHGCRGGSCAEGWMLAERAGKAQTALAMTRFLNEEA